MQKQAMDTDMKWTNSLFKMNNEKVVGLPYLCNKLHIVMFVMIALSGFLSSYGRKP